MFSRLARTSVGALVALLSICTITGSAGAADVKANQKCSAAIIKAGAGFLQAEAKILQKCRDTTLKGKTCDLVKQQASIDKARAKLASTITKACGGKDKICDTADADNSQPLLSDLGWSGPCPGFEGDCTAAITDCDDISACIQCISEKSVNQAVDLYYPPNRAPSTDNKTLNKCQAALGKAAITFFNAKSKALSKCWGTKVKKTATCPAEAQAKIDAARAKFIAALAKPCVGQTNATIGLPGNCLAVGTCGATTDTLIDVGNCAACVTEFKVDCPDRASSVSVGASYPSDCLIVPPTPTPTVTPTPAAATETPTATLTPSPTPTQVLTCGNNTLDSGEVCDPTSATTTCPNVDATDFPCSGVTCTCACPSKVVFSGDATDPKSVLDTGWTGISHRSPIITNGDVTVALSCPNGGRPCGVCTVSGPIANTGTNKLANQRCSNNSAIHCTDDTPCTPSVCIGGTNTGAACTVSSECPSGICSGTGTCEFFFGSNLPLAAGGVSTCVVNRFNGTVSGTANVESGEASTAAFLTARVFTGIAIDNPCPICSDNGTINDGVTGGTCSGGIRDGLPCDANGEVPGRPDFGRTSLDCPPAPGGLIASLPIDLSNSTGTVVKTLDANSPQCTAGPGFTSERCLCDTCNNSASQPCFTNADCPDPAGPIGPICGGKRCLGGPNSGTACNANSECPSGGCNRPGLPTSPGACQDDAGTPNVFDCAETSPGSGVGECTVGPSDQTCTVASGHAQRGCSLDADCGGGVGSCAVSGRACFLTGGGNLFVGSNNLTAVGQADPPVNDVSHPTLGAVFCVGPTQAAAINQAAGLPGPARVTIKGTAVGLP